MAPALAQTVNRDQRRALRVPFVVPMRYITGSERSGRAVIGDVSRRGMRIDLDQAVEPERLILLTLDGVVTPTTPLDVKGKVVWCRPIEGTETFQAGLQVIEDSRGSEPGVMELLLQSALMWQA